MVEEKALSFAVKNAELELGLLQIEREKIPTKEKNNLRDDHVIIAQKRRLLINAIKALNYNAEKWLQKIFNQFHAKQDETLSLIRSLFRQPGEVMWGKDTVEVRLKALDSGGMRRTLTQVLDYLRENNCLRLPDGRLLTIIQTP